MPKLTDLIAEQAQGSVRGTCPRCEKRQPSVYVQARVLKNQSVDPETAQAHQQGEGGGGAGGTTTRTVRSLQGVRLCRICASEVLDQIEQLLGARA